MADTKLADAFLRQAKADFKVAEFVGMPEFAARYFLQQSVEKALKAFGYAKFAGGVGGDRYIDDFFFRRHDPLQKLGAADLRRLSKNANLLRRAIVLFVESLPERTAIEKIDATSASHDPREISYRYPFQVDAVWTTPAEYGGWTAYQGGLPQVRTAVRKLLVAVADEIALTRWR